MPPTFRRPVRGASGRGGAGAGATLASLHSQADVEAVKSHWLALSVESRTQLLRFEDRPLVESLYEIQQSLFESDFQCHLLGFGDRQAARTEAGAHLFEVEGTVIGAGRMRPTAFFAKAELIELPDLFGFLEAKLGRGFLQQAPIIRRSEWTTLLRTSPNSWAEYVRIACRLVELAVLEAWREAETNLQQAAAETPVLAAILSHANASKKKRRNQRGRNAPARPCPAPVVSNARVNTTEVEVVAVAEAAEVEDNVEPSSKTDEAAELVMLSVPEAVDEIEEAPVQESGAMFFRIHSDESLQGSAESAPASPVVAAIPEVALSSGASDDDELELDMQEDLDWALGLGSGTNGASSSTSVWVGADDLLGESQGLRAAAREARIAAEVTPMLIASQAARASAREARILAEQRAQQVQHGKVWPPLLMGNGSSGEDWFEGFRMIIKNTFVDMESLEPHSARAEGTSIVRARSI